MSNFNVILVGDIGVEEWPFQNNYDAALKYARELAEEYDCEYTYSSNGTFVVHAQTMDRMVGI